MSVRFIEQPSASQQTKNLMKRILIADDDPLVRQALRSILEFKGYECDDVENGALALTWLEHQHADLVILDNQMPVLEGIECLIQLKSRKENHLLPVILLSGNLDESVKARAFAAGALYVFAKPLDCRAFLDTISNVLIDQEPPTIR